MEQVSPERRHTRIKKVNLVQISRFDEKGFRADLATGRTLDISRGGMRLELHHPLPLRSVVGVSLAFGDRLMDISGTVVYLEVLDHERCAMGIQFSDLAPEAGKLIDEAVASMEKDGSE